MPRLRRRGPQLAAEAQFIAIKHRQLVAIAQRSFTGRQETWICTSSSADERHPLRGAHDPHNNRQLHRCHDGFVFGEGSRVRRVDR